MWVYMGGGWRGRLCGEKRLRGSGCEKGGKCGKCGKMEWWEKEGRKVERWWAIRGVS